MTAQSKRKIRPDRGDSTDSAGWPPGMSPPWLLDGDDNGSWKTGSGDAASPVRMSEFDRVRFSGPGLQAFLRIAELWNLSEDEQMILLGAPTRSTFHKWKKDPNTLLSEDTLVRISYIIGIYQALHILLPEEERKKKKAADEWVRHPNTAPLFAGRSALDRMLSGQMADLFAVREYLDAQLGSWV